MESSKDVLALRDAINRSLQISVMIPDAIRKAQLMPGRVDLTPVLAEAIALNARAMAFLLDELLEARGEPRQIQFKERPVVEKGNGRIVAVPS